MKKTIYICLLLLFLVTTGCEKETYKLTLKDGEEITQVIDLIEEVNLSEYNLTKEGYTFLGWYQSNEKIDSISDVSSDITLNAKWEINKYTYKFVDYDDSVIKEMEINYGEKIIAPEDPTRQNSEYYIYTFKGWDKEFETIKEDVVIKAIYEEKEITCKVAYYNESTLIKEVLIPKGTKAENLTLTMEDDEYYLLTSWGWFTDPDGENEFDFNQIVTSDIIIYGQFDRSEKPVKCKVTFYDASGAEAYTSVVESGEKVEFYTVTKESSKRYNYVIDGWSTNQYVERLFNFEEGVLEHMSLYPVFKKVQKPLEEYDYRGKIISFLGDSITTFYDESSEVNSYYIQKDQFYFPVYSSTVKTVQDTWWYKLTKGLEMKFGVNNSLSGSSACDSTILSRIDTLGESGEPDIIVVYLGTNDNVNGYIDSFETKYEQLISRIEEKYPDTYIFCVTLGYSAYAGYNYTENNRIKFNESIRKIASNHSIPLIEFDKVQTEETYKSYLGDNLHPNSTGMTALYETALKAIKEYFKK